VVYGAGYWPRAGRTAPFNQLEAFIQAFRHLKGHGLDYPFGFELRTERELSKSYLNIGMKMGMDFGPRL
jgi:hypothetical protein